MLFANSAILSLIVKELIKGKNSLFSSWLLIWTYIFAICLNFGTPKVSNFPFGTNGKLVILHVQILKHIGYIAIKDIVCFYM